ncbi:MAG: GNAT family N-acetyltransferase [Pirellula sp.]|jgi:GNAT superfamily N-acetyltransferase|nr:GNAT family N-acetyltransferase [Pirellula sp.]
MNRSAIQVFTTRGGEQLDAVRRLRYQVLRQPLGLPFDATLFDGDELPTTLHLLAIEADLPIGCLTLLVPEDSDVSTDGTTTSKGTVNVQLRGMAVLQQAQGKGVGSLLLAEVDRLARQHHWYLWCKARQAAVPFYEKNGWRIRGEPFEIPTIGTHYTMDYTTQDFTTQDFTTQRESPFETLIPPI